MNSLKNNTRSDNDEGNMSEPSFFLKQFAGQWKLRREIEQATGQRFNFTGEAEFTWQENNLLYSEKGLVTAPDGTSFQAQRSYIWAPGDSHHIDVYFEDRRFFHRFSLCSPDAQHLCGNDQYMVRYDFANWPAWMAHWQVSGPRKDYSMTSCYQPMV